MKLAWRQQGPRLRRSIGGVVLLGALVALGLMGFMGSHNAAADTYGYEYCTPTTYQTCPEGHLIVIKHVVNDNGGTAVASDFTMTIGGVTAQGGNSFPGEESPGTDKTVTTGSYGVTETGPSGYSATFSADCVGTIAEGETKTCTVTNNDEPATLHVIKHVVNDNGGTAVAGNWTLSVNGGNASPSSFAGAESPGTTVTLDANASFTVGESGGPSGYTLTKSGDCTGPLAPGANATCTLTNDDQAATLHVIKHVITDNGGTAVAGDWTISVSGGNASPSSFAGAESPGTTVTVNGGASFTVSESGGPSGYSLTKSGNCTGPIPLGGEATCTLTNNDIPAHLIVIKHVINDNGGHASASNFTMTINGVTAQGGNSFPGAESPGTNKIVTPGSYSVSETGPSGYVAFYSANCTGTLALGETKTCTVTNNDIAPRQTIGYWKNHRAQTNALLPQTIGPYPVTTFPQAQTIFNAANCSGSKDADAVNCLAAQLLAAELNLANASNPCIQQTVNKANTFLSGGTVTVAGVTISGILYTGPNGSYTLTANQRKVVLALKDALDAYNNNKSCSNP